MNTNTPNATRIDLSNVLYVSFDTEPGMAYIRMRPITEFASGKFYRLTMSEFRTLIDHGSVSI